MSDTYELEQGKQLIDAFVNFVGDGDMRPAWKEMAYHIEDNFWQIFSDAVDSDGNPWAPHAQSTVEKMGPHDLLIDTGELLTEMADSSNWKLDAREMTVKVDLEYAEYLNFGTSKMPAREFMYLREDTIDKMMETLYYYIISKFPENK